MRIGDLTVELWPFANTDAWYWDAARVVVIGIGLLLLVLHARLAVLRWRNPLPGEVFTHPGVHLSYALLLADIILRRFEYIHQHRRPDFFLILSFVAVAFGAYGAIRRATVSRVNRADVAQEDRAVGERMRVSDEQHAADGLERRDIPPSSRRETDTPIE